MTAGGGGASDAARRHERVRRIFFEAIETASEERPALLDRACADDPELRREVEELLAELERDDAAFGDDAGPGEALRGFAAATEIPRAIGPHDVIRRLGEGGMGVVYEARQQHAQRRVAIKVLRPGLFSSTLIERFRRETQLHARLRHPGIASVLEAGEARPWGAGAPTVPYLVMELVEGRRLNEHATLKELDLRERVELLGRVADAVAHAHDRGVVHRDLKPANILVEDAGQPRVLDFGVARAIEAEERDAVRHTMTAEVVGTLGYMSPEQLSGHRHVGPPADVYALGVIAYELFAGRAPLGLGHLSLAQAIRRVEETEPEPLVRVVSGMPADVSAIVQKALEKKPEDRYADAGELAADLRRHLAHLPVTARAPGPLDRAVRLVQRHRTLTAAAAVVLVVLAGSAVVTSMLAIREARALRAAEAATERERRETYRLHLLAAADALDRGDLVLAGSHLRAASSNRREWTWRHLTAASAPWITSADLGVGEPHEMTVATDGALVVSGETGVQRITISGADLVLGPRVPGTLDSYRRVVPGPTGDRVVRGRDTDGRWWARTMERGLGPKISFDADLDHAPVARPGGGWLSVRDGRLVELSDDGEVIGDLPASGRRPDRILVAVTSDGGEVVERWDNTAWLTRLTGQEPPRALVRDLRSHRVSTDGRMLFVGTADGRVAALSLEASVSFAWGPAAVADVPIGRLEPSADGRTLGVIDWTQRLTLWDVATGRRLGAIFDVDTTTSPVFSADGDRLLVPHTTGLVAVHDARTGRDRRTPLRAGRGSRLAVAGLPDGRVLVLGRDSRLLLFEDPAHDARHLKGHESFVYDVSVSRDGSRVASVGWDGTVRTWDASNGAELAKLELPSILGQAVAWSPSGAVLASLDAETLVSWDVAGARPLATWAVRGASDVGAIREGEWLVACTDGTLEAASATRQSEPERRMLVPATGSIGDHPQRLALSPSAADVARTVQDGVERRRVVDGELAWRRDVAANVASIAWSPDGARIAAGTVRGDVLLLDASTGEVTARLAASGGGILALAFHPTEPLLVAGAHDGALTTWSVKDAAQLGRLERHRAYVRGLAFSPDGTWLASASGDSTVRLHDTLRRADRVSHR